MWHAALDALLHTTSLDLVHDLSPIDRLSWLEAELRLVVESRILGQDDHCDKVEHTWNIISIWYSVQELYTVPSLETPMELQCTPSSKGEQPR